MRFVFEKFVIQFIGVRGISAQGGSALGWHLVFAPSAPQKIFTRARLCFRFYCGASDANL